MAGWSIDLTEYARKKQVELKDVRKAYAFALYSSIVKKTPVDTGRARGNWNISVGSPDDSVDDKESYKSSHRKRQKENGGKAHKKAIRWKFKNYDSLPEPNGDESIFISNNLPYIQKLEYGSSNQAPAGMVLATLANNSAIFNAAVRAVKENSK